VSDAVETPPASAPRATLFARVTAPLRATGTSVVGAWRRRKLIRILGKALLGLVLLLVIARLAAPIVLPSILAKVGRSLGLGIGYEALELSLLSGEVELRQLVVAPIEGGEAIVRLPYLKAAISPGSLLSGRPRIRRIEVDGLTVVLVRDQDGELALLKRIRHAQGPKADEPKPPEPPAKPGPPPEIPSDLPIAVDEVLLSHVSVRVRDASITPSLDARLELDLRLADLGNGAPRPMTLEVRVGMAPVFERLRISARGQPRPTGGAAEMTLALERAHISSLAGYLAPLGISSTAIDTSFTMSGRVEVVPAAAGPGMLDGALALEDVRATADGAPFLAVDRVAAGFERIGLLGGVIPRVEVVGVRTSAARRPDGAVAVAGLEIRPRAPRENRQDAATLGAAVTREEHAASADATPHEVAGAPRLRLELGLFSVKGVEARFLDDAVSPGANLALLLDSFVLKDVVFDPARPDARLGLEARISAPGIARSVLVTGGATPFAAERALDLAVAVDGLAPDAIAPYLRAAGIESRLQDGRMRLSVEARATPRPDGTLAARLALREITFRDGEVEHAGVDSVTIGGVEIDPAAMRFDVDSIDVARPRIRARREVDGSFATLGLLVDVGAAGRGAAESPQHVSSQTLSTPPSRPEEQSSSVAAAAAAPAGPRRPAPHLRVARIALKDAEAAFHDARMAPPATLGLHGANLEITGVDVDLDPSAPDPAPGKLRAWVALPGLVERVEATGRFSTSMVRPSLRLEVKASGIAPEAASTYLALAGVRSELNAGRLEVALEAGAHLAPGGPLEASFNLEKLALLDGPRSLFRIEGASIGPVTLRSKDGAIERVDIAKVALGHLSTSAEIGADAALHVLGLAIGAPTSTARPETTSATAQVPGKSVVDTTARTAAGAPEWHSDRRPPAALPIIRLEALTIGEVALGFQDASRAPAFSQRLTIGVDMGPLTLDLSGRATPEEAPLRVRVSLPETLEALSVDATLTPSLSGAKVRARVVGEGLTYGALRGILAGAGLAPATAGGTLGLSLAAEARIGDGSLHASVALTDIVMRDGAREFAGVDAVIVTGVAISEREILVDAIEVKRPRAAVWRDAEGGLIAAGLRVLPPAEAARLRAEMPPAPPAAASIVLARQGTAGRAAASVAPATESRAPPRLELRRLRVVEGGLRFDDAAVAPAAAVALSADLALDGLAVERNAAPATLRANVRIAGVIDALTVTGTARADLEAPTLDLQFDATGVRAGPLASYLPPGVSIPLKDGRLGLRVSASAGSSPAGGLSADLGVQGFEWRDGPLGRPHFRMEQATLRAPRIDVAAGRIVIDEASVSGIEIRAERTAQGAIAALGVLISPPPTATASAMTTTTLAAPLPGAGATTRSAAAAEMAGAPPATTTSAARPEARSTPLPSILVRDLRFGVKSATFADRARAGSSPVALEGLLFRNSAPIELLGPDPTSNPAVELELTTRLAPLIRLVKVGIHAAPFATHPDVRISIGVEGIRGDAIPAVAPELAQLLDGRGLEDGRFGVTLTASLDLGRRAGPLDFDVSRGFGAELAVTGAAFRDGARGPVLLGLSDLRVDVARIDPGTGDVRIRSIEIEKPQGDVFLARDGLHALGLVIKVPTATAAPEAPKVESVAARPDPEAGGPEARPSRAGETASKAATTGANGPAGPEVRVDRLSISGIDFTIADRTAEPPMVMPLTGLDVEVAGLTTRALTERHSVRFEAFVKAGHVRLPKRAEKEFIPGMGILGAIGDVAGGMVGIEKKVEYEMRPAFEEITLRGEMALAPRPFGSARFTLGGLELSNFAGPAKAQGVDLKDGVVDVQFGANFTTDGSLVLNSRTTLTDVDLSEAPDGPISRILKLPAPLNAVIYALRDESGGIALPVNVDVAADGISASEIGAVASAAFLRIVGGALASAPLRALGSVTDFGKGLVSFVPGSSFIPGMGASNTSAEAPIAIAFQTADPKLPAALVAAVERAAEIALDDDDVVLALAHEAGAGDLARAKVLANPSRQDRHDAIARSLARRMTVQKMRRDAAAEARAAQAVGLVEELRRRRLEVATMDRELAQLERVLDAHYALERDGAERQAERRTREILTALARARLGEVERLLVSKGLETGKRIRIARPRVDEATRPGGGEVLITVVRPK